MEVNWDGLEVKKGLLGGTLEVRGAFWSGSRTEAERRAK